MLNIDLRRWSILIIAILMIAVLAACDSAADEEATEVPEETTTEEEATEEEVTEEEATEEEAMEEGSIWVLLPDSASSARWETDDRRFFEGAFEAAGVDYNIVNA
ncbi:MAG TPA: hypothetical protein VLE70_20415, partial [Anaerolineae bacterium]|nr:hypothetical protein [Anaerolineae bacterium]